MLDWGETRGEARRGEERGGDAVQCAGWWAPGGGGGEGEGARRGGAD